MNLEELNKKPQSIPRISNHIKGIESLSWMTKEFGSEIKMLNLDLTQHLTQHTDDVWMEGLSKIDEYINEVPGASKELRDICKRAWFVSMAVVGLYHNAVNTLAGENDSTDTLYAMVCESCDDIIAIGLITDGTLEVIKSSHTKKLSNVLRLCLALCPEEPPSGLTDVLSASSRSLINIGENELRRRLIIDTEWISAMKSLCYLIMDVKDKDMDVFMSRFFKFLDEVMWVDGVYFYEVSEAARFILLSVEDLTKNESSPCLDDCRRILDSAFEPMDICDRKSLVDRIMSDFK